MLNIYFELKNIDSNIHEFDLGHLTINDGVTEITSKFHSPCQSFMIFTSISHFLFTLEKLSSSSKKIEFGADDSSFRLFLKMNKSKEVKINDMFGNIIETGLDELLKVTWDSVNRFYEKYADQLQGTGAAKEDWDDSMFSFKQMCRNSNLI